MRCDVMIPGGDLYVAALVSQSSVPAVAAGAERARGQPGRGGRAGSTARAAAGPESSRQTGGTSAVGQQAKALPSMHTHSQRTAAGEPV